MNKKHSSPWWWGGKVVENMYFFHKKSLWGLTKGNRIVIWTKQLLNWMKTTSYCDLNVVEYNRRNGIQLSWSMSGNFVDKLWANCQKVLGKMFRVGERWACILELIWCDKKSQNSTKNRNYYSWHVWRTKFDCILFYFLL